VAADAVVTVVMVDPATRRGADERRILHAVPRGHLQAALAFSAPFQLLQQSALSL
jgi:hypothetical protein